MCDTFILGLPEEKQAVINIQMKSETEVSWVLMESIFILEQHEQGLRVTTKKYTVAQLILCQFLQ